MDNRVYARKGIKSIKEVKRIAISRFGSNADFAARYRRRVGNEPSYVAAQAAAAGYLALAAHGLGLAAEDLPGWRTSTLLSDFALDGSWRQVGHRVTTIRWRDGRMVPLVPRPGAHGGLD